MQAASEELAVEVKESKRLRRAIRDLEKWDAKRGFTDLLRTKYKTDKFRQQEVVKRAEYLEHRCVRIKVLLDIIN
ncbi:MAG: hypothetical protein EOP45_05485 [Sphingobacteriaceae bacterium]|nr:MAG: hypothetical protein EOP45_05485 [Sphingobacteriaceae bacterium]